MCEDIEEEKRFIECLKKRLASLPGWPVTINGVDYYIKMTDD